MVNCCPFDETPLLRFVRRQLTPFPSTFTSTQSYPSSYPSSYTPFDSGYMTRQSGCANNSLVGWNTGYYGNVNTANETLNEKSGYSSVEGELLFPFWRVCWRSCFLIVVGELFCICD